MSKKGKKPNSLQIIDSIEIGRQLTELHEIIPHQFQTAAKGVGRNLRNPWGLCRLNAGSARRPRR